MNFRSHTGEDFPIALTSGHTCVVSVAGNPIDEMFWKEAVALGCLPADSKAKSTAEPEFDRDLVIGTAIEEMITDADPDDFLGDGRPDLRKLNARLGFKVEREEADRIFAEVSKG